MRLQQINKLVVFEAVARLGSFTRAADELGLTKGTVSQHVAHLEEQMGLRLLHRTSRSLALTTEGERILPHCAQVVEAGRATLDLARSEAFVPSGEVRMTTSHNLATQYLSGAIIRFRAAYPGISVDMVIRERHVDLVEEGIDVALRAGTMADSDLMLRRVGSFSMIVCASPEYLARVPAIGTPKDLENLDWVSITPTNPTANVELVHESGRRQRLAVGAGTVTNSGLYALATILGGGGIGLLPDYAARKALADRRLVNPLDGWRERHGPISLVWSPLAKRKLRVKVLIDFLVGDFGSWSSG